MPTELLYRDDATLQQAEARVLAAGPEGVLLDRTPSTPRPAASPAMPAGCAGPMARPSSPRR
ncbi:hypothetical protein ACFQY5_23995 [Paeniroseomonas aquatica]|uniref:hypothetical protein n=1 Tax=Paeniroseomonas aquatica TaxID=373043 RepID=UPI00362379DA